MVVVACCRFICDAAVAREALGTPWALVIDLEQRESMAESTGTWQGLQDHTSAVVGRYAVWRRRGPSAIDCRLGDTTAAGRRQLIMDGGGAMSAASAMWCILHPLILGDDRSWMAAYHGGVEMAAERCQRRQKRGGVFSASPLLSVDHRWRRALAAQREAGGHPLVIDSRLRMTWDRVAAEYVERDGMQNTISDIHEFSIDVRAHLGRFPEHPSAPYTRR